MASPFLTRKRPDYLARAAWHDYSDRCIYLVTFNAAPGIPAFSTIEAESQTNNLSAVCRLSRLGEIINSEIRNLPSYFPHISVLRHCVMPDHVHLVIFVRFKTDTTLGQIIASLKGNCSKAAIARYPDLAVSTENNGLFRKGFNDKIVLKDSQLKTFIRYVEDNPRRYHIRKSNPQYFCRVNRILINEVEYACYGNFLLLRHCLISAVRISRRFTPAELKARRMEWDEVIRSGGVLVSPFISAAEKEIRNRACESRAKIILLTSNGFPDRYKPAGREFELCAEGRLLIIAPTRYTTRERDLSRAECLRLNALAELIAAQGAALILRNK